MIQILRRKVLRRRELRLFRKKYGVEAAFGSGGVADLVRDGQGYTAHVSITLKELLFTVKRCISSQARELAVATSVFASDGGKTIRELAKDWQK